MTRQIVEYPNPLERPEVEVLVDGAWHFGQLTQWVQNNDDSWSANVTYTAPMGDGSAFNSTWSGRFAAEVVRPNKSDRSYGRA